MSDIGLFSTDDDGVVTFSFKNLSRKLTGPEEALQFVAATMFTDRGSNKFAKGDGGDLLSVIGRNIKSNQETRVDAALIASRTMETVRRNQRVGKPADATVVGLDLLDAFGEPSTGTVRMKIRIRLQSGNSFTAQFRGQTT